MIRNFQCSIRRVTLRFRTHTSGTGLAVFLDEGVETRPSVLTINEFKCLVLTRVSRRYVIMSVLYYAETKSARIKNIDTSIKC